MTAYLQAFIQNMHYQKNGEYFHSLGSRCPAASHDYWVMCEWEVIIQVNVIWLMYTRHQAKHMCVGVCVFVCVCLSVCVLLHIYQAKHMYTRHQAKHSCSVSRRVVWWCCLWSRTRTRLANQCYTWYVKWTTGWPNIFPRMPKRPPTIKGLLECICISR